jgi:hypothetical protein
MDVLLLLILILSLFGLILIFSRFVLGKLSDKLEWSTDQKILPYAHFDNSVVKLFNIRNFTYESESDYVVDYYDKDFDLDKIKKVYFIVEPFGSIKGIAHTFLSFEFEDNSFISVSVEIRKKVGQSYSIFKSFFIKYNLVYVIGDEKDLIKLRTNYRYDDVYMYPIKTPISKAKKLFLDVVESANKLHDNPRFYNVFNSNCTTVLLKHANKLRIDKLKYSWKIFLPAYSDRLIYENGLIDTDLSFEDMKKKFRINSLAKKSGNLKDFSLNIRKNIK